ncbi:MAG: hypothetical protein Q9184_007956, partial [Pyrenodesmia sp. 2 TL-2023]
MGAPISTPTPANIQLMPIRVPITPIDGESTGCEMAALGAATKTPESRPYIAQNTTKPAVSRTAIHANSNTTAATEAARYTCREPKRAAASIGTVRPKNEPALTNATQLNANSRLLPSAT